MSEPTTKALTKTALARALKVSRPTLGDYIALGVIPAVGPWDILECQQRVANHRATLRGAGGAERKGDDDLRRSKLRAEVRKLRADARAKELKNKIAAGEMLDRTSTVQWARVAFEGFRRRLECLPDEIAKLVPG